MSAIWRMLSPVSTRASPAERGRSYELPQCAHTNYVTEIQTSAIDIVPLTFRCENNYRQLMLAKSNRILNKISFALTEN